MPYDLTDMEIDEISFVRKGANQEAKIVLFKSADGPRELDQLAKQLRERERGKSDLIPAPELDDVMTHAEAIAKVLDQHPELYDEEVSKDDPWDAERMDAFVDVERLADQLQLTHRYSRAEAVAKAVSMRPEVYDRVVLMSAKGSMQQETAR